MQRERIDEILGATLEDRRLSRGERRALKQTLVELDLDEDGRRFWRNRAFALAENALAGEASRTVLDWLHDVVKAIEAPVHGSQSTVHEAYFSPGDDCRRRISSFVGTAASRVDICVFTITDNEIASRIEDAHKRGIRVRIITDNDKSNDRGSDIDRLASAGIPVRVDRTDAHMHHKYAVADDAWLLTGSYNWTVSAARSNEENILVTNARELHDMYQQQFDRLWQSLV